ncbi:hypothetical protein GC170_09125 [bacterium]|nr:hypothetical protein [bacterium]
MNLIVQPDGTVTCLYDDALDLTGLGRLTIARASHVEPTGSGQWTADMSPVNGPVLGPFRTRTAALHAERTWLEEHRLKLGR